MANYRKEDYTSRKSPYEMQHYIKQDRAYGQASDRRSRHHFWKDKPVRMHHRHLDKSSQSMEDSRGGRSSHTRSGEEDSTSVDQTHSSRQPVNECSQCPQRGKVGQRYFLLD